MFLPIKEEEEGLLRVREYLNRKKKFSEVKNGPKLEKKCPLNRSTFHRDCGKSVALREMAWKETFSEVNVLCYGLAQRHDPVPEREGLVWGGSIAPRKEYRD